ncbi:unnamed protein product [Coffea canephora]|uniref:BAH domain-containing protein n=1 Tax=Coffea canephora TaxID=49390 RepID=A0A068UPH6_COFCA|nr:unnamed protein product [Coffea canephora]
MLLLRGDKYWELLRQKVSSSNLLYFPIFDIIKEDLVLFVPEEQNQKPKMAIIKDIIETADRSMIVAGYMFYRPEEAELRNVRFEQPHGTREVFYSFHRDEFPAESVMHKCVAHFISLNQQIPPRIQYLGFIVQWVYNTRKRRLFELTHKHYSDNKRKEIDLLIQKTKSRLEDPPVIESEYCATGQ